MDWAKITKDTPLEEIKRIHQTIWDYAIENGRKPDTPYVCNCAACEWHCIHTGNRPGNYGIDNLCYDGCPIAWDGIPLRFIGEFCGKAFYEWDDNPTPENAKRIRDMPFKYELEVKENGGSKDE